MLDRILDSKPSRRFTRKLRRIWRRRYKITPQNFFKLYKINGQSSCGAVFAIWLASANNDEGERMSMRSSRRHVLEDIEIKDDKIEEETGRVSICISSKNALLLIWCISDPMKMAVIDNCFNWDANAASKQEDVDEGGENINKEIEDIE
ncbi:Uncharacterized protein Fot_26982 [Forsythia ovata]|uniref:Uncharacterized protein n=1 Tax=Forsythia ovata TaxID=205694 RepID=A0ABD1UDE8_9LAMI